MARECEQVLSARVRVRPPLSSPAHRQMELRCHLDNRKWPHEMCSWRAIKGYEIKVDCLQEIED